MTRTTKNITKDPFVGQPKLFSDQFLPSNNFFFIHFRAINIGSQQRADTGEYKKTNRDSLKETAEKVGAKDLFPTYQKKASSRRLKKVATLTSDSTITIIMWEFDTGRGSRRCRRRTTSSLGSARRTGSRRSLRIETTRIPRILTLRT